ncbi:hypothetical protein AAG570_010374 [Ranatra chinensis]|uniref:Octanoyl-[acyl-carrier-protein]:protein N-octanoyltransferase LIPT2, mitochondrial n=1 Tax=Ranatra chinensis TaxID=642074 RepID=A0ABD0ZAP8_9HEMI
MIQNSIANNLKLSMGDFAGTLILVEHNPVYTIGIRKEGYTLGDEEHLKSLGADFYKTNRGGLITFHGPGQMVAYPILNLKLFKPSMHWYVSSLEDTVIHLCSMFSLNAEKSPYTGVWVNDKKICAIGIHGSRYITTHGLALNCNIDLTWFDHIVPCGINDKGVTSLTNELGKDVNVDDVSPKFLSCFSETFSCDFVNLSLDYFKLETCV